MSGIAGVWHRDGRPLDRTLLARMHEALRHRGADGGDVWLDGAVGLSSRLNRVTPESLRETQPAAGPGGTMLVWDGRLDNRDELLALASLPPDTPDPDLVLAAYAKAGRQCAERLNGDFAFALYDPPGQSLLLARDALGVRPLYYASAGHALLFASEIKALLATGLIVARPNDALLADVLLRRSQLNADRGETFFAGIASVPPGHAVLVTPGQIQVARHWSFDLAKGLPYASFEEHAEAFRELFAQAVRRRLRSAHPVAVSVSGGLDSSTIFGMAHRLITDGAAPGPLRGVTSVGEAGSPSDEACYVAAIEQSLGVSIARFSGPAPRLTEGLAAAVASVEAPLLDMQWNRTRAFQRQIRDAGARVLLTGHWGDQVLFDQSYLVDLVRQRRWSDAWRHLHEFPRWFTDSSAFEFFRAAAVDLVREFVPGGGGAVRAVRRLVRPGSAVAWYTPRLTARSAARNGDPAWRERSSRAYARAIAREAGNKFHTLYLEWNNKALAAQGLDIAFPFLDRDLVQFLIAAPGETANHRGVPKALLRAGARAVLPAAIADRRWKADFSALVNGGVQHDLENIARLLGPQSAVARLGYVTQPVVARAIGGAHEALSRGTCELSWALRDLVGLETWLQVFCERESPVGG